LVGSSVYSEPQSEGDKMKKNCKMLLAATAIILFSYSAFSAEQMTIMVDNIKNRSGEANDWISRSITDTVIGDLSHIKGINVVSGESRSTALEEISMGQTGLLKNRDNIDTGHMLSANIVLNGSCTVIGSKIRILVQLTDVKTGSVYRTVKLDGNVNNLFDLQDKIVQSLLAEVEKIDIRHLRKIKISEEDRKKIADSKIRIDPAAYKLYSAGLKIRDKAPEAALNLFQSAFELSPDFANAYLEAAHCAGIRLKKFNEALAYMKKADSLYLKAGMEKTISYYIIYYKYAYLYYSKKDYDSALDYMFSLTKHLEKYNYSNTALSFSAYSIIGSLYNKKDDEKNFIKYYHKAFSIAEKLSDEKKYSLAHYYSSYARYAYARKLEKESLKYYAIAIDYFDKYNNILMKNKNTSSLKKNHLNMSEAMINYAFILMNKDEFNEAIKNLNSARHSLESQGLVKDVNYGRLFYTRGEYYRLKNDYKQAESDYLNAIKIFETNKMNNYIYKLARKRLSMLKEKNNLAADSEKNLLKNGDFENKFQYWGTGLYSRPDHKNSVKGFWGKAQANARFSVMKQDYKNNKSIVLIIENRSPVAPHVYKTTAQRITGLKSNTDYILEYMAFVKNGKSGVLFFTFDPAWSKRTYTPMVYGKWEKHRYTYNTGNSTYADLRIITENTGEVWIDDIKFFEK